MRARGERRRLWVIVGALCALGLVLLGLALSYLFLVVRDQPLAAGSTWDNPGLGADVPGAWPPQTSAWVIEYTDRAEFTVDAWLRNNGRFDLTVTGVQLDPTYWAGLFRLVDARAGVLLDNRCCIVDHNATWAARGFVPFTMHPGDERPVVLRYRIGHCEDNGVGGSYMSPGVVVLYDVLGNGHTTGVPFYEPLVMRYSNASECPRPPTYPQARSSPTPQLAPQRRASPTPG